MAPLATYTYAENMSDIFAEISSRQSMHNEFLSHMVHNDDEANYQSEHNNEGQETQDDNDPSHY
jgi:hypothetical protein